MDIGMWFLICLSVLGLSALFTAVIILRPLTSGIGSWVSGRNKAIYEAEVKLLRQKVSQLEDEVDLLRAQVLEVHELTDFHQKLLIERKEAPGDNEGPGE